MNETEKKLNLEQTGGGKSKDYRISAYVITRNSSYKHVPFDMFNMPIHLDLYSSFWLIFIGALIRTTYP